MGTRRITDKVIQSFSGEHGYSVDTVRSQADGLRVFYVIKGCDTINVDFTISPDKSFLILNGDLGTEKFQSVNGKMEIVSNG